MEVFHAGRDRQLLDRPIGEVGEQLVLDPARRLVGDYVGVWPGTAVIRQAGVEIVVEMIAQLLGPFHDPAGTQGAKAKILVGPQYVAIGVVAVQLVIAGDIRRLRAVHHRRTGRYRRARSGADEVVDVLG